MTVLLRRALVTFPSGRRVRKGANALRKIRLALLSLLLVGCVSSQTSMPQAPSPEAPTLVFPAGPLAGEVSVPTVTPAPTPVAEEPPLVGTSLGITVPQGFAVNVYAQGLGQLTALAYGPTGHLFVAELGGRLLRLEDRDRDGKADTIADFASGFRSVTGIALRGSELYVSSRGTVAVLRDRDGDGRAEERREIISGLPVGDHQNNGPAFGPDGKLYLPVGSTCNACSERDARSATIMRFDPDGRNGEIYARGLRNVYQLAFHPEDGTLWSADNGRDDLGLEVPDELNLIVRGGHYGWPSCWGQGKGQCEGILSPVVELEPRSSADGLVFYMGGQFPPRYRGNLFIAMWGSNPDVVQQYGRSWGRKVVRVVLEKREGRYTGQIKDFATGFDRPLALAVDGSGALLVADYAVGAIYRISYVGSPP